MLNGIDCIDTFQYVFDGIPHRVLSRLDSQTLMAHILKGDYFLCHFLCVSFLRAMCLFLPWYGQYVQPLIQ